jgi:hypothetical protein
VQEMPHGAFSSAKLQSDGTVEVTGPFRPGQGEPKKPTLVAFYLVQDSNGVKVDGEGRWLVGEPDWTGRGGSGLEPGPARGTALAILAHDNPPGFVAFSWNSPVEVTEAD